MYFKSSPNVGNLCLFNLYKLNIRLFRTQKLVSRRFDVNRFHYTKAGIREVRCWQVSLHKSWYQGGSVLTGFTTQKLVSGRFGVDRFHYTKAGIKEVRCWQVSLHKSWYQGGSVLTGFTTQKLVSGRFNLKWFHCIKY